MSNPEPNRNHTVDAAVASGGQDILQNLQGVQTPAVLVDLDVVQQNIARAQTICEAAKVAFRPHIKTHKIPRLAVQQLRAGAQGITCQKLSEAEVFANAGIADILISYNIVGEDKLSRLQALAARVSRLQVCADSEYVAAQLSWAFAAAPKPLPVFVECDTGGGRCGVQTAAAAAELATRIAVMPGLQFAGLLTYPPPHQIQEVNAWLVQARDACKRFDLPCPIISSGGTPDLPQLASGIINEYRAGTYIYNDRSMLAHGACEMKDCAMSILSTVVSAPAAGRFIIDAGSKTLSSDLLQMKDYGEVLGMPKARVVSLSEEHGIIEAPLGEWEVGARLRVLPNHACAVTNLADEVVALRSGQMVENLPVVARGKTV